jgi:hypothetical protein
VTATDRAVELVFGEGADRVCRDIPEAACREQPRNLAVHLVSLSSSKTADGLLDPKLVLAWLVTAIGGSATAVGLLVPLREAFALLPQLFIAEPVRRQPTRSWIWASASIAQGLVVLTIGLVALFVDGPTAAWLIVALIVLFGGARSVASVSYKDVLGKTVSKARRGTVTGTATSIAAAAVLIFGAAVALELIPLTTTAIASTLLVAAGLWLVAGTVFFQVAEEAGATQGGAAGFRVAVANLKLLRTDRQLLRFVITRSLLTVTAVAPPYVLALASAERGGLGTLGPFVIASAVATMLGGRVWGRLSDVSSRRVLVGAATVSTALFLLAVGVATLEPSIGRNGWIAAGLLFLIVLAYQGVRLGRSTHLVDMADADDRARYTAVSNTVVGVVILATGGFGALSSAIGLGGLFAVFAGLSAIAAMTALGLEEVQAS